MKNKLQNFTLLLTIVVTVVSSNLLAQIGILSGYGMSTCQQYSTAVCSGTFITPISYSTSAYWQCSNSNTPAVAFNINGSGWIVQRDTWFFQSNVDGQITGYSAQNVGLSIAQNFPAHTQISPVFNASATTVQFTPDGPIFDATNFSISINPVTFTSTSYTYCAGSPPIYIGPIAPYYGGTWSYSWTPGGATGNPIQVSPLTSTIYTVTATSGSCSQNVTVAVTVTNCPSGPGNYCSGSSNPLTGEYEMPLNFKKYRFTGQSVITPPGVGAVQQDMVSIGYNCGTALPPAKFNVIESQTVANTSNETYAAYLKNTNAINPSSAVITGGVYGESKKTLTSPSSLPGPINAGGVFEGLGTDQNIGVLGRNWKTSLPSFIFAGGPIRYNIGGAFISDSVNLTGSNFGVYGSAALSANGNIGVYGNVPTDANNYFSAAIYGECGSGQTGPTNNAWAGYFNGDVNINGNGYISGVWSPSDAKFKTNIRKIENITDKIKKINGYTYNYDQQNYKEKRFDNSEQIGFLAQELKEIFPQLVKEDKKGQLSVNYSGMVPILLEAIKTQQKQIDDKTLSSADVLQQLDAQKKANEDLKTRMDQLEQMLNSCCNIGSGANRSNTTIPVELSDENAIVLNQNVPNPYAESTIITYSIPNDFTKAQIIFSTSDGKVLKTVDITAKGNGRLNVFANDLTSGVYIYSLIVDGKEIASKKMIKN